MCHILEFCITQILISTTSRFECISRLIKVTDNNDARWKLEKSSNTLIAKFKKIRQVGADLFHADGHDETNSRFSQFWQCSEKSRLLMPCRETITVCLDPYKTHEGSKNAECRITEL
jgi:hypothetical protein